MQRNDAIKLKVITIDGPAGVGKTTIAKNVSQKLNMAYLDTGAMFRSLALRLGEDASLQSEDELSKKCSQWTYRVSGIGVNTILFCNDIPIQNEIRAEEVGMLASKLATIPCVRHYLKSIQQDIGGKVPLVAEGRDMGTVVFPKASFKFFLDAKPEIRALRRLSDLQKNGQEYDLALLTEQICTRDKQDRNRLISPLCPARDAIIIDSSNMSIVDVESTILQHINATGAIVS